MLCASTLRAGMLCAGILVGVFVGRSLTFWAVGCDVSFVKQRVIIVSQLAPKTASKLALGRCAAEVPKTGHKNDRQDSNVI